MYIYIYIYIDCGGSRSGVLNVLGTRQPGTICSKDPAPVDSFFFIACF